MGTLRLSGFLRKRSSASHSHRRMMQPPSTPCRCNSGKRRTARLRHRGQTPPPLHTRWVSLRLLVLYRCKTLVKEIWLMYDPLAPVALRTTLLQALAATRQRQPPFTATLCRMLHLPHLTSLRQNLRHSSSRSPSCCPAPTI